MEGRRQRRKGEEGGCGMSWSPEEDGIGVGFPGLGTGAERGGGGMVASLPGIRMLGEGGEVAGGHQGPGGPP